MSQKLQKLQIKTDALEVGREYLISAPGAIVLAVYTGTFAPPGGHRELPRFAPVGWVRGAPDDPDWPVYAGPRARVQAITDQEERSPTR